MITKAFEEVFEKYLKNKEIPFSSKAVMESMLSIVDLLYISHDSINSDSYSSVLTQEAEKTSETKDEVISPSSPGVDSIASPLQSTSSSAAAAAQPTIPSSLASWACDSEPEESTIDSWARGSVPVRKRNIVKYPSDFLESKKETTGFGTTRSRRSAPTSRNLNSSQSKRSTGSRRSKGSGGRDKDKSNLNKTGGRDRGDKSGRDAKKKKAVVVELQRTSRFARGGSPSSKRTEGQRSEAQEQDYLRLLESREAEVKARQEKIEQEAKEEQERFEKYERDMKGRDYVVDKDGNAVPIVHPKPESLAPMAINVPYDLVSLAGNEPHSNATPGNLRSKAKAQRDSQQFFTHLSTQQPSLLSVIELNPGVNAREQGHVREGPQVTEDPAHLSMKRYKEKFDLIETHSLTLSPEHSRMLEATLNPVLNQVNQGMLNMLLYMIRYR